MSKKRVIDTNLLFGFIKSFIESNKKSPTVREIQDGMDIKSTSIVAYNVGLLIKDGLLKKNSDSSRNLEIKED